MVRADTPTPGIESSRDDHVLPTLNACMLAYTFYENDGRVIRYAKALVERGATVDVIALGRPGQSREEEIDGVRVIRVQSREKNERSKLT
jgi:hypothetical protein